MDPRSPEDAGFSTLEVAVVIAITMIVAAASIPFVQGTLAYYRLSSAVTSATGAIQSTRYQAIMRGYPYQLALDPTTNTYQVSSDPTNSGTFSNVGSAVPFAALSDATLSAATTLQLKANGTVQATQGALNFNLSNTGTTKTITVSGVGDVSVSP